MAIKINRRFQAGAYRWLGGKHYWILDTKTGIRYKGLNQSNYETVNRLIRNSHDLDRLASTLSHYTYEGRKEALQRMAESFRSLMEFRYGSNNALLNKFEDAIIRMNEKDPELWNKFVEKNNEYFTEYWDMYNAGAYNPFAGTGNKKNKTNARINKEAKDSLSAIINAMNKTIKTGKVADITHNLKDYSQLVVNDYE